jgi:hypothetical protein
MRTSLLVVSLLTTSTNAIDIKAMLGAKPAVDEAPKASDHKVEAPKASDHKAAPLASDHKADAAKVEDDIKKAKAYKKAAAVKAPADKAAKPDDDVVAKAKADIKKATAKKAPVADKDAVKTDDKEDLKCNTQSCQAARDVKEEKEAEEKKYVKPVAVVHHDAVKPKVEAVHTVHHDAVKPKMEVVHKADKKTADKKSVKAVVHAIKVRPAVKKADPATKAHQKLTEANLKASSSSQEAANEKAKVEADTKS